ncbi:MAG TPA: MFS transporter [Gammaproteobacteria bacterium]|nr:MFS transporter [Gammaproteobacteria bacterium]
MSTTSPRAEAGAVRQEKSLLDSQAYKTYVLAVLVLGYIFNVIDRGVFGILVQQIKESLQVSDTFMGLVSGTAFAVCYAVMGIPIARLADRWSRVNVLSLAIGVWSVATALTGAAFNHISLFFARATTAVGEAGGSPPSHSLISDYFPLSQRATALAIYAMAVPFGTAIGNFVSGHANLAFGWRMTFVLVGLPGLLVALLIRLTLKETPRGYSDGPEAREKRRDTPPFFEVFRFLLTRNSFMHMSVAAALHSVVWYAGSNWNSAFFQRSHGMDTGGAGNYLAMFALIGAIGSFSGGFLSDKISTRYDDKRWYMWVPGIACVVMVPFQFLSYLSPNMSVVVPSFSIMVVLASFFFGPSFAVAQSVATVRMRAVSTSVLLFIQTIIGLTLGPLLVGLISDYFTPTAGSDSLRYGMVIVGLANIWAAFHYFMGSRKYREDLAETARLNAARSAA